MNTSFFPTLPVSNLEDAADLSFKQVEKEIIEKSRLLVAEAIKSRGHGKPPFLSQEFTQLVGVNQILRENLGELGGMLLRYKDGYVIKVNRCHPQTRQNFSIFHEVGHILLNKLDLESCVANIEFRTRTFNPQMMDTQRSKAIERLCDIVATELLMPEDIFKAYLSRSEISISSMERLAAIFGTSIQSTAMRIAETSPKPCISMLWKPRKTTNSQVLRLSWTIGPGRNPSAKDRYLPVTSTATKTSTVYRTYETDQVVKCHKTFKTVTGNQRVLMEAKGYGHGKDRYVISLAYSPT